MKNQANEKPTNFQYQRISKKDTPIAEQSIENQKKEVAEYAKKIGIKDCDIHSDCDFDKINPT